MTKNETATLKVTLLNSTPDNLSYTIHLEAPGFIISSSAQNITATIPSSQTAQVTWLVTASETGERELTIEALSSADLKAVDIPAEYRWQTSFREACGVAVVNNPLTSRQMILLSLSSMLVGAAHLWVWFDLKIWSRISRPKQPPGLAVTQTPAKPDRLKAVAFYLFQIVLLAIGCILFNLDYSLRHGADTTSANQGGMVITPTLRLLNDPLLIFLSLSCLAGLYVALLWLRLELKIAVGVSLFLLFFLGGLKVSVDILVSYCRASANPCGLVIFLLLGLLTRPALILLSLYAVLLFIWLDPKIQAWLSRLKQPLGLAVTQTPAKSEVLKAITAYLFQIVLLAVGTGIFYFFFAGEIMMGLDILSGY